MKGIYFLILISFYNANEKDVFKSLNNNFEKKIEILRNDIKKSGKAERDIIKWHLLSKKNPREIQIVI